MTTHRHPVLLFPGQALYTARAIDQALSGEPKVAEVAHVIDSVAAELGEPPVFRYSSPAVAPPVRLHAHTPAGLDLGAFAVTVSRYQALHYPAPTALIGHSFGHLTALTCAGAFTLEDAARLMFHRNLAIQAQPAGRTGMACIALTAQGTGRLLRRLKASASIACHNAPQQTVVAGKIQALERLRAHLAQNNTAYLRLPSQYAFHTPAMAKAARTLGQLALDISQRPLRQPVYSATLGRFCHDDDDLIAHMSLDMIRPVHFLEATLELSRISDFFVDCGPTGMLARLVAEILPEAVLDGHRTLRR